MNKNNEILLKQIDGNVIDLSTVETFVHHYDDIRGCAHIIIDQINAGRFSDIVPGKIMLDVGANVGLISIYMAPYFDKIIAMEPYPGHFSIMQDIIKQKGLLNIVPVNSALYDRCGMMKMNLCLNNTTTNNMVYSYYNGSISVPTVTISEVMRLHNIELIDFMKMDIEGSEMKIIPDNDFFKCCSKIKRILLEVHDFVADRNLSKLHADYLENLLTEFGFTTNRKAFDIILAVYNEHTNK